MPEPENAGRKQRGKPFRPGQSGNPAGKPQGTRHRVTLLAERLMEDDARDVVLAVIGKAKDGDMAAARLVLERIAPARRGRAVAFDLPQVNTAAEASTALGALLNAVSGGVLSAEEAGGVAALLEMKRRAIETVEFERRISELERR